MTPNPPEDVEFLRKMAMAGFATYIGSMGLIGAKAENRYVVVIHRGRGRRWEITLGEDEIDTYITKLTRLPERSKAAIAWLSGETLVKVRQILEP